MNNHELIMMDLISRAKAAAHRNKYPVCAAIVEDGNIVAVCDGIPYDETDPTAHPERVVLSRVCTSRNQMYLPGYALYSTLEPCPMCTSAAIWAKLDFICFGASQSAAIEHAKDGDARGRSWRQIPIRCEEIARRSNARFEVVPGVCAAQCEGLFEI